MNIQIRAKTVVEVVYLKQQKQGSNKEERLMALVPASLNILLFSQVRTL